MKTVGYYLDYMAQSFGVSAYTALETKHLNLFKKYLHNIIQDWEARGDMDYNKQMGMYKTRSQHTGTVTANLGTQTITLSAATDFYAVGCDIQIGDKTYIIQQMSSTVSFKIWPAYMDANTTTASFTIRFNRFPVPPLFKKILNRRLVYLSSMTDPYYVTERDFASLPKDNTEDYPLYYQIKYSSRQAGMVGTGTVSSSTLTVTSTQKLTSEMANMPIRFVGTEELYYLRDITSGGATATLDRDISTAISVAVEFQVLPEGSFFIELYPHPNESKQIIYDYVQTEEEKISVNQGILAPSTVIEAGLDTLLARFSEESASSKQSLAVIYEGKKDASKMKVITDFSPTLHYLGMGGQTVSSGLTSYGRTGYSSVRNDPRRRG